MPPEIQLIMMRNIYIGNLKTISLSNIIFPFWNFQLCLLFCAHSIFLLMLSITITIFQLCNLSYVYCFVSPRCLLIGSAH